MTLLLATRRADTQDALHKVVPVGAVRAETALPPEHRPAQRLFGSVIGWLDAVFAHERPERVFMRQQLLTHPLRRVTAPRTRNQQRVDRRLDRRHGGLQGGAIDGSFAEQVPEAKDQAAQDQEVRAPDPQPPAPIDQRLKIALQMAPAQLMALRRQRQIGPMAIRPHNPVIGRPQQVAQTRPVAASRDIKEGGNQRDHGPEPAPFAGPLPAGFVNVAALLLLDGGVNGAIDRRQGRAAALLQGDHTPQTERQAKEIRQQAGDVPIAEVVVTVQDGDHSGSAWAKGAGGTSDGRSAVTNSPQLGQQTV
jgi:hypothetical protein